VLRFIVRRLLWMIPVVWFVGTITFVLMHAVPGGPFDGDEGTRKRNPVVVQALKEKYGLDRPMWQQYVTFLGAAAQGDLGVSYSLQGRPVTEIIRQGLPATASLGAIALAVALLLGVTLGVLAALRPGSLLDYASIFLATAGASSPSFVIGIVLIIIFSVTLGLLPTSGWGRPAQVILPALALGLYPAAFLARLTRSAMLEALGQDYIRTARSKGLSYRSVIIGHALKNSLIPVLTVAGPIAAHMAVGSFIIESLFSIPGIGRLYVQGVEARDYGLIMGATLFYAVAVAMSNLIVDVLYAYVDPRVRY